MPGMAAKSAVQPRTGAVMSFPVRQVCPMAQIPALKIRKTTYLSGIRLAGMKQLPGDVVCTCRLYTR